MPYKFRLGLNFETIQILYRDLYNLAEINLKINNEE
jgi:hypothetical protein